MKQSLFNHLSSLCTRNFLSPRTLKLQLNDGNNVSLTSLSPSAPFILRLLSSKADSSASNSNSLSETNSAQTQKEESFTNSNTLPETNSAQTQKEESSTDVDDVSSEELRRRIERYFRGDEEAIPSIFEAILKRKLAGKHDDSDDELMEEFGRKLANDVSDEEFDSEED